MHIVQVEYVQDQNGGILGDVRPRQCRVVEFDHTGSRADHREQRNPAGIPE